MVVVPMTSFGFFPVLRPFRVPEIVTVGPSGKSLIPSVRMAERLGNEIKSSSSKSIQE